MHTINLPYKQGYATPVPAAVVVNTYEFREAEDPSIKYHLDQKFFSYDDFTWSKELSDQWIFLKQNLCHKKPKVTRQ